MTRIGLITNNKKLDLWNCNWRWDCMCELFCVKSVNWVFPALMSFDVFCFRHSFYKWINLVLNNHNSNTKPNADITVLLQPTQRIILSSSSGVACTHNTMLWNKVWRKWHPWNIFQTLTYHSLLFSLINHWTHPLFSFPCTLFYGIKNTFSFHFPS